MQRNKKNPTNQKRNSHPVILSSYIYKSYFLKKLKGPIVLKRKKHRAQKSRRNRLRLKVKSKSKNPSSYLAKGSIYRR